MTPAPQASTLEIAKAAMEDARELARLEIALAKNDFEQELAAAKTSAILGASSIVAALLGMSALAVALGLAVGPWVIGAIGITLLLVAIATALAARTRVPNRPMGASVARLERDATILREHLS